MAAANQHEIEDFSEPDISSDDMGPGLGLDERIQANSDGQNANANAGAEPAPEPENRRRRRAALSSIVWKHFKKGEEEDDGSYSATCNYCARVYPMGNQRSTSSLRHHIKKGCKHIPSAKRHKPDALQRLLQAANTLVGEPNPVVWEFSQATCRKSFAKMVIAHEYPFNCANHHFLRSFLSDLQPAFKLPSRNTIRLDCMKVYEDERSLLYGAFGKLDTKFSFTSDLWTSNSRDRGFMSLTCHYIDDLWVLRKRTINFTPLPSPHTGKNISRAIFQKLVLWNLDKRVFSLVLDNASANDVAIKELLDTTTIKNDLPVGGQVFHQRCGCHVLNLIVQDGLHVLTNEISKIRETMKYIRNSQGRMEKFQLAATQVNAPNKKPAWDVPTRWNSTFLMLELAVELREAINRFAALDNQFQHCPTENDWTNVEALLPCLKVFYGATLKLSGTRYPTINLFFPEFCEVYLTIKKMETIPFPFVVDMGREMFKKWTKYWENGNALLAIACILDPRCKLGVVEYYYKMIFPEDCNRFIDNLKACLKQLCKEYLELHSKAPQNQVGSLAVRGASGSGSSSNISDTRAGLKEFLNGMKSSEPTKSELEDYLAEPLDEASVDADFDILAWWKIKAPRYPVMSRIARDVLAVPISTVASESTFSTAGRTLSAVRSSLSDESIEALICTQDWLRASVTETGAIFGDPLWSTGEAEASQDGCICA